MSGDEAKRKQILDGAGRAFGRYGYRKTTMGDVVREAGVARATVYKYFAKKEDVFRAVIEREVEDIVETVRRAAEGESSTYDRLQAAVAAHSAALQDKVNVFRLTMEALSDVFTLANEDTERLSREAVKLYGWILSEGVNAGEVVVDDVETAAWSIILSFKGVFMTSMAGQMSDMMPGVVDTLLDIIWNGLKPRGEAA